MPEFSAAIPKSHIHVSTCRNLFHHEIQSNEKPQRYVPLWIPVKISKVFYVIMIHNAVSLSLSDACPLLLSWCSDAKGHRSSKSFGWTTFRRLFGSPLSRSASAGLKHFLNILLVELKWLLISHRRFTWNRPHYVILLDESVKIMYIMICYVINSY